jgi:hypothetical protein
MDIQQLEDKVDNLKVTFAAHQKDTATQFAIIANTIKVTISVASLFMAIIMGMLCWFLNIKINQIDEVLELSARTSILLQALDRQVENHAASPNNHLSAETINRLTLQIERQDLYNKNEHERFKQAIDTLYEELAKKANQ